MLRLLLVYCGRDMKLSPPNQKAESLQRRERWRRDHAAARTLNSTWPQVERVCVNLRFESAGFVRLAPQSHVLHGPAQAFFDFPCPYADCDGTFDLKAVVSSLVAEHGDLTEAHLDCGGHRPRPQAVKQPCLLHVDYAVSVRYR
jgi:hypothetical protein